MLAASGLLVVFLFVFGFLREKNLMSPSTQNNQAPESSGAMDSLSSKAPEITPPAVELKVAPTSQIPEGTTLNSYSITASLIGYNPNEIVVKEKTIINIQLVSKDGEYDIYFPDFDFYVRAQKNTTKETSFKSPEAGSYVFECRDFCPVTGKIKGRLTVIK